MRLVLIGFILALSACAAPLFVVETLTATVAVPPEALPLLMGAALTP